MDFEREVKKHKDAVYRQMLRACGNAEDAEDALATATIKAYKAADTLDDPSAFRAWLTTIGRRVCIRIKQRSGTALSLEALEQAGAPALIDESPTADDILELERTHACVLRAFEALPDQYKDVYRLREIEGLSAEETSKKLGLTVANVKSRLHRARHQVRALLDEALLE